MGSFSVDDCLAPNDRAGQEYKISTQRRKTIDCVFAFHQMVDGMIQSDQIVNVDVILTLIIVHQPSLSSLQMLLLPLDYNNL